MGSAFLHGQGGGGTRINGIVKTYAAETGNNINAGDFVSYINEISLLNDKKINNNTGMGEGLSAVQISDNKVFIAHGYNVLYGTLCTIDNNDITVNTTVTLSTSTSYTATQASAVLLSNNRVFIAHGGNASSTYLYAIVCTIDINNNTITNGIDTKLSSTAYSGKSLSSVLLSDNKVFIAYGAGSGSSGYVYGIVCNINDMIITAESQTQLAYGSYYGADCSVVMINETKLAIFYSGGSSYCLYGLVCTISGNTITKGTQIEILNSSFSGDNCLAVLLSDNKVFVAHSKNSNTSNRYLFGIVCTIDGTTITTGTDTQLTTYTGGLYIPDIVLFPDDKVGIFHYSSDQKLAISYCTVDSDNTISLISTSKLSDIAYSYYYASVIILNNTKIDKQLFVAHSGDNSGSTSYLYAGIVAPTVGIYNGNNTHGIAKTSAKATQYIDVYVPA